MLYTPNFDHYQANMLKVRLNLAVCPDAWLMPAKMVINTESTVGYNNKLKQAVPGMRLGVNNEVNPDTKKVGVALMEGGPSKIKRQIGSKPTSNTGPVHSNTEPVHSNTEPVHSNTETAHENNKIWLITGSALAAFVLSHAVS